MINRQFVARLSLAVCADMVFVSAFGHGLEAWIFAIFAGAWVGAGGRGND